MVRFQTVPFIKDRKCLNCRLAANFSAAFGAVKSIDLTEGIRRMAAWAKQVGARQGQEFNNIEITEKLPQGWNLSKKEMLSA